MENRFSNRDFEQFVKQNADQYRMYPSEKVWKNINYSLHTRRKWYGLGLALLLLTTGAVTFLMMENGKKENAGKYAAAASNKSNSTTTFDNKVPIFVKARIGHDKSSPASLRSNAENLSDKIFPVDAASEQRADDNYSLASVSPLTDAPPVTAVTNSTELVSRTSIAPLRKNAPQKARVPTVAAEKINTTENIPAVALGSSKPVAAKETIAREEKTSPYPLTIESVVNAYKYKKSRKKLSWEVYFSPTISYRRLEENKSFINSALANTNQLTYYTAISDINSLVTHKPDIGLQLGFSAGYPIAKNLKLTGGLQFNVSKYDIRAYTYNSEVATIALNTGASSPNTVSTIANYRNFSGDNASWIRNLYISASMPVGLEFTVKKTAKADIGIAGTIQPTYLLGDRVYLLSTDYKNYVEVPSLTRKWNISGGFEAFARITTGKVQWRIGPNVRYQMLSSFDVKYPVKEHLFDFGIKLGVMLKTGH